MPLIPATAWFPSKSSIRRIRNGLPCKRMEKGRPWVAGMCIIACQIRSSSNSMRTGSCKSCASTGIASSMRFMMETAAAFTADAPPARQSARQPTSISTLPTRPGSHARNSAKLCDDNQLCGYFAGAPKVFLKAMLILYTAYHPTPGGENNLTIRTMKPDGNIWLGVGSAQDMALRPSSQLPGNDEYPKFTSTPI